MFIPLPDILVMASESFHDTAKKQDAIRTEGDYYKVILHVGSTYVHQSCQARFWNFSWTG